MNRRAMLVPIAVAVSLSMGFAGCGGDDDDKKLSKSDLGDKANELCTKAEEKRSKLKTPAVIGQDAEETATYFTAVVPLAEDLYDDLDDLKPADDVKAAWTQFLAREKQSNELLVVMRDKAKAKDVSGQADFAKFGRVGEKLKVEAAAVGATSCN